MIKCEICGKDFVKLGNHLRKVHNIEPKDYYDIYLKKDGEGICPTCNKETSFIKLSKGYAKHCCIRCASLDKDVQDKHKKTNLERYGVEYISQSNIVKNKTKETCQERYGVPYSLQVPEIRKKIKKTNLEKYGVEYPIQSENIKEKRRATNLELYGTDEFLASQYSIDKRKTTNIEKYGVENISQVEDIKNKKKQTCQERYGIEYSIQSQIVKDKIRNKYGVECPMQSRELRLKAIQTMQNNENNSSYEDYLETILNDLQISYKKQYKEERYPYFCDFYLPKFDTFIEINGTWMHGGHFFDSTNDEDKKKLELWTKRYEEGHEQYKRAIDTWTTRDLEKRNCAIRNSLNYVVLWNKKDIEDFVHKLQELNVN